VWRWRFDDDGASEARLRPAEKIYTEVKLIHF
jgi:hypothetical protein